MKNEPDNNRGLNIIKTGYYSSIFLSLATIITFGFAMTAIPPSGPYCHSNCMEYPFAGTLSYYPRDYFWMYSSIFQLIGFLILMISIHFHTLNEKKIFSFIGLALSMITVTILLSDYFVQFAVVPISFMKNEIEGISLISQYNGHGIFIALEELGYLLMSLSMLFIAFAFPRQTRLEKTIRLIFILAFIGTLSSFLFYTLIFGIDRSYRFEVATITVNFLALIINGILLAVFFIKQKKFYPLSEFSASL